MGGYWTSVALVLLVESGFALGLVVLFATGLVSVSRYAAAQRHEPVRLSGLAAAAASFTGFLVLLAVGLWLLTA